jgi:hypothetical protein
LDETPIISITPRRDGNKKPRNPKPTDLPSSYDIDTSSVTVAEASFTEIDLGYATEDWLLDSDASQALPCPTPALIDASNSNLESSMAIPEFSFNPELDSNSFWWHDLSYPTNPISTQADWIDPFESSLLSSQNWSTGLDTIPMPQINEASALTPIPNDHHQGDNLLQPLSTVISPLDGYLADSEDEAYVSCEERKARVGKQGKRQSSLEPRTVPTSDISR